MREIFHAFTIRVTAGYLKVIFVVLKKKSDKKSLQRRAIIMGKKQHQKDKL
jgi:hypothetical protein